MSVESVLETAGKDLTAFWTKLKADVAIGKAVWGIISSPQTRSAMIAVFKQAVVTFQAIETAVGAEGVNVTYDSAVVTDVKQLIADAQAGDGVIKSDLAAIGVLL